MKHIDKNKAPILLWLIFEAVAVILWLSLNNIFYLLNFTYIGTAIAVGVGLYLSGHKYARMTIQLAVGLYMLIYLGLINRENMQIEGFWYYLFSGTFQAAVIHYLVAKIAGHCCLAAGGAAMPAGRLWC